MEVILNLPRNALDQDFCYLQQKYSELIAFIKLVCHSACRKTCT